MWLSGVLEGRRIRGRRRREGREPDLHDVRRVLAKVDELPPRRGQPVRLRPGQGQLVQEVSILRRIYQKVRLFYLKNEIKTI